MNILNSIPLPQEEQAFLGKTLLTGLMNGVLSQGFIITGSVLFVVAITLMIKSVKNKSKNPHIRFLIVELLGVAGIGLFLALMGGLSKTITGFAIDFVTNFSQIINAIAMIIDNPQNWWRIVLLVIPALFLPKLIRNLFQRKPWHFSSIGKIFGNMFAGASITFLSLPILFLTGKSRRQRQIEDLNQPDGSKITRKQRK